MIDMMYWFTARSNAVAQRSSCPRFFRYCLVNRLNTLQSLVCTRFARGRIQGWAALLTDPEVNSPCHGSRGELPFLRIQGRAPLLTDVGVSCPSYRSGGELPLSWIQGWAPLLIDPGAKAPDTTSTNVDGRHSRVRPAGQTGWFQWHSRVRPSTILPSSSRS